MSQIAAHPAGAEVVFDYGEPIEHIDPALRAHYEERLARVAELGEPFLSHFVPAELHRQLRDLGFAEIDDLDVPGIMTRLFGKPPEGPSRRTGGHVLFAATSAKASWRRHEPPGSVLEIRPADSGTP